MQAATGIGFEQVSGKAEHDTLGLTANHLLLCIKSITALRGARLGMEKEA